MRKFGHFYCNKVLPLVYDQSLSYYEVLCKLIKKINEIIENPAGLKIADPIEWDITSQYEAETLVIDSEGNAYISIQPVPAGVSINDDNYWVKVFNFGDVTDSIKASIASLADETGHILEDMTTGDLVWYGNTLYQVTEDLSAGSLLIPDTNCEAITLEDWLAGIKEAVSTLEDDVDNINDSIGDINDHLLSVDEDIEELKARESNVRIYNTVSALVSDSDIKVDYIAITRGYYTVNDGGGGIYKILAGVPSEPYVSLNNGLYASMILKKVVTPQMFGARGNGSNDDTQAFVKMFACDIDDVFIPSGTYVINNAIIVSDDKKVTNNGTFSNCKPIWRRNFDLKQSKMFGVGKEYTLNTTDAYVEAVCYDSTRNKFYLATRNYSQATESMDLLTFNGNTYAQEAIHTFPIAAAASMSYNSVDDKIYVTTTGSGAGKTNALYSISVATWNLSSALSVPNNEQFTMFDDAAKVFVQFYIPQDSNNVYIKVYNTALTTLLHQKMITLLSTDKPQQGFCVHDGHVYTPTYNSILEIDYISGEVNRLTILYHSTKNYEEMEDFCVANGVVYGVGHKDGETGGKERFYVYNYDNYKNYESVTPLVINKRTEAIPSGSLVVPANSAVNTAEFDRPTYEGYSIVSQRVEGATGGGQGNLIYSLKSSQHDVRIFNPTSESSTLTSLYVTITYVRNDVYAFYGL